jgi:DNA polymerase III alpha subunit
MMSVEQLVESAVRVNAETIVMTDINNSTGMPEFVRECNNAKIKPAAGIEFHDHNKLLYIGIARNNEGFRELNEFLTKHNFNKTPLPFPAPSFANAYIIYSLNQKINRKLADNERIGVRPNEVNSLLTLQTNVPRQSMVVLQPVTLSCNGDIPVHKSLRAVDNNILLSHLRTDQHAAADEQFKEQKQLDNIYSGYPGIITNTRKLLNDCNIEFDFKSSKNKQVYSAGRYDDVVPLWEKQ